MTEAEREAKEADDLVEAMRALVRGKHVCVVLAALDEMQTRVLSEVVDDPEALERALARITRHLRGCWLADRGGPFLPS